MKVLFCTQKFYPETGGLSVVTDLICRELLRGGWQVEIATSTPADARDDQAFPYPVLRCLGVMAMRRRMRAADCVVLVHLSIRHLLAFWLSRATSLTVMHADIIAPYSLKQRIYTTIFRWHLRLARNTAACSDALRRQLRGVRLTLRNPYDDALFFTLPDRPPSPSRRLAFVGRFVSDKGVRFAIEALALLRQRGHDCDLTLIGDGPDLLEMRTLARRLELEPWVTFCGAKTQQEIPGLLRTLGTLLVPSDYFEAFGIVVIEALASGTDVVAFSHGGLPEAVGAAGLVCEENTARGLAAKVEELLTDDRLRDRLHSARAGHLEQFRKANAAAGYREVIAGVVEDAAPRSAGLSRMKGSSKRR